MTDVKYNALKPFSDLLNKFGIGFDQQDINSVKTFEDQRPYLHVKFFDELLELIEPGDHKEGFVTITDYPGLWGPISKTNPAAELAVLVGTIEIEVNDSGKTTITFFLPARVDRFVVTTQTYTTDRTVKQGDIVTISGGYYSPKHMEVFIATRDFTVSELLSEFNDYYTNDSDQWIELAVEQNYLIKVNNHHNIVSETDNEFLGFCQKGHRDFYVSGVSQSTAILVPVIED